MNERIDELFGQTMDQAVPETWTTLTHAQLLIVKDKFAELIVRECADVAKNSFVYWPMDGSLQRNGCARTILNTFGVEE